MLPEKLILPTPGYPGELYRRKALDGLAAQPIMGAMAAILGAAAPYLGPIVGAAIIIMVGAGAGAPLRAYWAGSSTWFTMWMIACNQSMPTHLS